MWLRGYINDDFSEYLNRYLKGILVLRSQLKQIEVFYTLSEAFSNHACRFYIRPHFTNFQDLTDEEKSLASHLFYDHINANRYEFVSFVYQGNQDRSLDVEAVRSFIIHYQFATSVFEGFVKSIVPSTCIVEVKQLDSAPFFNYIDSFLGSARHTDRLSFHEQYFETMKRHFHFDCGFHDTLLQEAKKYEPSVPTTQINDRELCDKGGGDQEAIRRFVMDRKIPFRTGYSDYTISEIHINQEQLKLALKDFKPAYEYYERSRLNPGKIISIIEEKEATAAATKKAFENLVSASGLNINDIALFSKNTYGQEKLEIGKILKFGVNYNYNLESTLQPLKQDLNESKLSAVTIEVKNILFFINKDVYEANAMKLKNKQHLEIFLRANGSKPKRNETKRKKR